MPDVQSVSVVQPPAQSTPAASQPFGSQLWSCVGAHLPLPWHVAARVARPPVHVAARHDVVASGYAQRSGVFLLATQRPPHFEPSVAQLGREPCGPSPSTGVHVPSLPTTSQASHCPVQADVQQ